MLVTDLMTRNVNSCRPENNLAELAKVMRKQRCGALPIVDGSGRVTGIITDRDICIALGMKNIRASVMVWGCVWYNGKSELCVCEQSIDTAYYINILGQYLIPCQAATAISSSTTMHVLIQRQKRSNF